LALNENLNPGGCGFEAGAAHKVVSVNRGGDIEEGLAVNMFVAPQNLPKTPQFHFGRCRQQRDHILDPFSGMKGRPRFKQDAGRADVQRFAAPFDR
jgi:hypothetical protein